MLQQAIGGVQGEIRVMMQYVGLAGADEVSHMLLETGTQENGSHRDARHGSGVDLEGAPMSLKDEAATSSPAVEAVLPIPNSFPQNEENTEFSYAFMSTMRMPDVPPPEGRWSQGPSIDGKVEFTVIGPFEPLGQEPKLAAPDPGGHAQMEQMTSGGIVEKAKRMVTGE